VFDVTGDDEAFAGAALEFAAGMFEGEMAADDEDHLFVRVGVTGADPALFHFVADEHHVLRVAHDLAAKAGFGRAHDGVVGRCQFDGVHGVLGRRRVEVSAGFALSRIVLRPAFCGQGGDGICDYGENSPNKPEYVIDKRLS